MVILPSSADLVASRSDRKSGGGCIQIGSSRGGFPAGPDGLNDGFSLLGFDARCFEAVGGAEGVKSAVFILDSPFLLLPIAQPGNGPARGQLAPCIVARHGRGLPAHGGLHFHQ